MLCLLYFFFNDTAATEIYTLSLHDALPISGGAHPRAARLRAGGAHDPPAHRCALRQGRIPGARPSLRDRKSTRLNSSHANISYAVFCLKKKKPTCTSWLLAVPLRRCSLQIT